MRPGNAHAIPRGARVFDSWPSELQARVSAGHPGNEAFARRISSPRRVAAALSLGTLVHSRSGRVAVRSIFVGKDAGHAGPLFFWQAFRWRRRWTAAPPQTEEMP